MNKPATAKPDGCIGAAMMAEQEFHLPVGLLNAIGTLESGNSPLAIDINGKSVFPSSEEDAAAVVQSATLQGDQSIDVGCFQIDLRWHPDAFARLADAFDPLQNARAAAAFLISLRRTTSSWAAAVARYHSATEGADYAERVLARWSGSPYASDAKIGVGSAGLPVRTASAGSAYRVVAFGMRVTGPGNGRETSAVAGLPVVVTP